MHLCPVITLESRSFRIKSCSRIRFAAPRSEATDFHAAFDSKSIIAFSIYVKYPHCSNVPRQFPAVQSKKLPPRMILSGSFILDCRFALLTLIGTVQECDNLRSGAGIPGAEQAAADTAGHAVLLRPCDCISIIGIRCHITERAAATDCGAAGGSIEECDRLLTGAGGVRTEFAIARSKSPFSVKYL